MIKDIIGEIEAKIRAESISAERKDELLKLLASLKAETAALKEPAEQLRSSLTEFEQSHPKLVQAINSISNTLSNIGI
ncbi:MAG TPA: DUF4404 family protein [Verrucomicrobiae bacterium]|jgi:hypothetical protein